MAMIAGSVVIAANGSETKSGMAEAIYDAFIAAFPANAGMAMPPGSDAVPIKRGYAAMATNMAVGLVAYMQAHATAEVDGAVAGLQISTALGNPTAAHGAATIHLPIQ